MKKISIIIPVYNTEHLLRRCVQSCINQDVLRDDYEIIIVNDGSTDGSLMLLMTEYGHVNNITIINQDNKGLSGARNAGLRHASGEYIWFVDSDDWIEEKCLSRVTEICMNHNLDILQICAANIINDVPVRRFHRESIGEIVSGKDCLKNRFPFCAPFSIYSRSFLIDNNLWFYEGIYHEDNEFTPRVYYQAQRVEAIDDILYYVYQNPDSITRTVNPKKSKDCIVVMNSLDGFSKDMDEKSKKTFSDIITSTMNVALHDTLGLDIDERREFAELLRCNGHLLHHLKQSSSLVYRIEAFLLSIFKNHPIEVYKLLNLMDFRSVKNQEV